MSKHASLGIYIITIGSSVIVVRTALNQQQESLYKKQPKTQDLSEFSNPPNKKVWKDKIILFIFFKTQVKLL